MFVMSSNHKQMESSTGNILNLIAYAIYVPFTVGITFWVGRTLHKNGAVYLRSLFTENTTTALAANDILLIAYYLLNIGYSLLVLYRWQDIQALSSLIGSLSTHLSLILLTLASIHFMNLIVFNVVKNRMKGGAEKEDSS